MGDEMKRVNLIHVLITGVIFLVFMIFVLPGEAKKSEDLGLEQSPDTSFFYTKEELYSIAESYGEEGRTFYIHQRFTFDFVWPIAYGLFLAAGLAYVTKKSNSTWVRRSYLLPIIAVFIDYLENMMTATVMHRYPEETILLGDLAGYMTSLKWITLTLSFLLLIIGIYLFTIRKIKEKKA